MRTRIFLLIFLIFCFSNICISQIGPPSSGDDPGCWPPPCVPIDGGISLLIAAGAIYGGIKLYSKNKNIKN